jgi:type I restriction enzyme S subunit
MSWAPRRLDQLGYLSRGRSRHRPRDAPHLYEGPYPFIQTGDVKHAGLYITDYVQTYSEAGLQQSRLWPTGTLCITIAANIADTAILGFDACFPDSVIGFIPEPKKSDAKFIKYLFDATVKRRVQQFTQGAAQDNLSQEKLLSIEFLVPTVDEQERIANVLSAYDDLIENNRRRIALLEEGARQLFQEWFVRLRFPGHEHTRIANRVPEGWREVRLHLVLAELESGGRPRGGASDDEGVPSIGAENVLGLGRYDFSKEKYIPEDYFERMTHGVVRNRDVVLYKDGANIGRASYLGEGFPHEKCAVNEHVFILRTHRIVGQNFLYFWITREENRKAIANLNANTAQPGISQDKLRNLPFLLPADWLTRAFNEAVDAQVRQIFRLASMNRQLSIARDLLLPRLMIGESGLSSDLLHHDH